MFIDLENHPLWVDDWWGCRRYFGQLPQGWLLLLRASYVHLEHGRDDCSVPLCIGLLLLSINGWNRYIEWLLLLGSGPVKLRLLSACNQEWFQYPVSSLNQLYNHSTINIREKINNSTKTNSINQQMDKQRHYALITCGFI